MIITRHAPSFFKIQVGDLTLAINPPGKDSKIKASRFGADIVLSSSLHDDHLGGEEMTLGGKTPFVITGPGEYEIKDVFIRGLPGTNTIYTIGIEGMKVCFLGPEVVSLLAETKEGINDVDILFVNTEAYKLAVSLEARIIIPIDEDDAKLKAFLKEGGSSNDAVDKLTLKKKDLEGKEGEILPLNII